MFVSPFYSVCYITLIYDQVDWVRLKKNVLLLEQC